MSETDAGAGIADPQALADRVLALVGTRAEASVRVVEGTGALTRFANSVIHQNVAEAHLSVALNVSVNRRQAVVTTTRVDEPALARLVESALEAATLRPEDPDWPGLSPPVPAASIDHYDPATAIAAPLRRAELVRDFVNAGPGLLGAGYCDTNGHTVAYANSAGQRLAGGVTSATVSGIHQAPTSAGSAFQASIRVGDLDGAAAGARAATKAQGGTDAVDLSPGRYEVLLEPECLATMLFFLAYAGFNAKAHAEGRSFAVLGEQQLDSAVNIWDDGLDPRSLSVGFDAEGTPKQRLDLVRRGVTVALAHDRRTAAKATKAGGGAASTGHALGGSEVYGPVPTDLYLEPGRRSPDDLVASVERGLLVTELHYCRILDPKTQVVTGLTRNGTFLVERGEVVGAVRDLRFTQSFVEALAPGAVLGIGSDARLSGGEDSTAFVPSVHLASWNFTGGARG